MNESPDNFSTGPIRPNSHYAFRVNGRLGEEMQSWFEDMTVTVDETTSPPQTLIHGVMRDQAALYGLISRIRDLGLTLLSVNNIENEENS
jgi:hypothetical protein